MAQSLALVLRERWAVEDPFLDFLQFMHDKAMYEAMREAEPMRMRRVVLEVLVPDDEFPTDAKVAEAVDNGLAESTWGALRDVMVIRNGEVLSFDDAEWTRLKATHGEVKSEFKVQGAQTGHMAVSRPNFEEREKP